MQDNKENKSKDKRNALNEIPKIGIVWVTALVVAAFLLGFAVRGFVLPSSEQSTGIPQFEGSPTPGMAPPLTEEQLQQGEMPAGHPSVGGESTTPAAPTAPATQNQNP